jgi:glycosyltransferase involved in cell wall biosynthesis
MLRVALVSDWFLPRQGGIELHLRDLALALRARGVDARLVTPTRGSDMVDGVPVHRLPVALAPGFGFAISPRLVTAIGELLDRERFDVVHAHASVISPAAYAGALAGALRALPTVLTFHSMLHRSAFLLGASESLFGWAGERVLLTAVSSVVASQAARWMPGASVGVLPNGVDTGFWRAARREEHAGVVHFASAMRLSRKKRPAALVRAFAHAVRFTANAPELHLTIAGEGPARCQLQRLAKELGIGAQLSLPGQLTRDALRELYGRADVFVLPSEHESFGIAALEARAAGLPVIAMLASGARDFIAQGVNGVLAANEGEITRAMTRVALDAPFRNFVAARNRDVPPAHDWTEVAAQHLAFYDAAAALRSGLENASQR